MEIEELLNGVYGNLVHRNLLEIRVDMFFHRIAIGLERGWLMLWNFVKSPPFAGICAEGRRGRENFFPGTVFLQCSFNQLLLC